MPPGVLTNLIAACSLATRYLVTEKSMTIGPIACLTVGYHRQADCIIGENSRVGMCVRSIATRRGRQRPRGTQYSVTQPESGRPPDRQAWCARLTDDHRLDRVFFEISELKGEVARVGCVQHPCGH